MTFNAFQLETILVIDFFIGQPNPAGPPKDSQKRD